MDFSQLEIDTNGTGGALGLAPRLTPAPQAIQVGRFMKLKSQVKYTWQVEEVNIHPLWNIGWWVVKISSEIVLFLRWAVSPGSAKDQH